MKSFIRGMYPTLQDFNYSLANMHVTCMNLLRLQLKSTHKFIEWRFVQHTAALVTLHETKYWYVKNQANFPRLTHAYIATLQPALAFIGNINSNFDDQ